MFGFTASLNAHEHEEFLMTNIYNAKVSDSTLADVIDAEAHKTRRFLGRIIILAAAGVVLAAALGAFDMDTSAERSQNGVDVQVGYPAVARAGNEIDLEILVSSEEPLPGTFAIHLTEDYLLFFEDLAVFPDPESQSSDATGAVEFVVAPQEAASRMLVRISGRASDRWDLRTSGNLRVQAGSTTVNVPISTWRIP